MPPPPPGALKEGIGEPLSYNYAYGYGKPYRYNTDIFLAVYRKQQSVHGIKVELFLSFYYCSSANEAQQSAQNELYPMPVAVRGKEEGSQQ